jgi:hypothetical protein
MARGPCTFRQRDLARTLRAMVDARVQGRVEIDRAGKIVVVIGAGAEPEPTVSSLPDEIVL